jgi:hypothetical protein
MEEHFDVNTNKKFTNFLIKNINNIWNNSKEKDNLFPGAHPVSLERKNFEKLNKYVYYIGPRTKGERCILYFLNDKNGQNQSVLINRNLQVFNVTIHTDDAIYNGTVFDGEFCVNSNTFFIHDSPMICGNKINKNCFSDRIDEIKCCIENTMNIDNKIKLKVKIFSQMSNINSFKEHYEDCETNGMVFIPDSLPVISGTQYSMFIWRPVTEYTFDFEIHEIGNDILVKVFNLGEMIKYAKIIYSSEEGKSCIDSMKKLDNYKSGCIVRCLFSKVFIPVEIITTKTHPNSLRTVERILFNIHENIMFEEFE